MATRCCWPPESWRGVMLLLVVQPDASQELSGLGAGDFLLHALDADLANGDVLEHRQVLEEIEALKDHADLRTASPQIRLSLQLVELAAAQLVADEFAVDAQFPRVVLLQVVDAAKEGALARARRPDETRHLAARHD